MAKTARLKERMASHVLPPPSRRVSQKEARDPLQYLPVDVVDIIFALLPSAASEMMRRVSRSWKKASEEYYGASAFMAHFADCEDRVEQREGEREANLRFRRRRKFVFWISRNGFLPLLTCLKFITSRAYALAKRSEQLYAIKRQSGI